MRKALRAWHIAVGIAVIVGLGVVAARILLNDINFAVSLGNKTLVDRLLDNNPQIVDKVNHQGMTPLHRAVNAGKKHVVETLLEHGANTEVTRSGGFTPLHDAIVKNDREIVELLLKHDAVMPSGELSAPYAKQEVILMLLDIGVNIEERNQNGSSALDEAASRGRLEILELLLKHGADVNAKGENGTTALHWAALRGQTDAARILIENGAEIDVKRDNGDTPLGWALRYNQLEVTKFLLANGANVHAKVNDHTLLHELASQPAYRKPSRRRLMPVPGGEPTGDDPVAIAKLLLDQGADVNANSNHGTPLALARQFGNQEMIQLLLRHGAKE